MASKSEEAEKEIMRLSVEQYLKNTEDLGKYKQVFVIDLIR